MAHTGIKRRQPRARERALFCARPQQNQADEDQRDTQSGPESYHSPPEPIAQEIPERESDHPISDQVREHRCTRISCASQRSGRHSLQTTDFACLLNFERPQIGSPG